MDVKVSEREPLLYEPSKVSWAMAEFIQSPPSLVSRSFVYLLTTVCLVAAAYGAVTRIAVQVEARGALVTEGAVFPVKTSVAMRIAKLNVRNHQQVKKGEVLLVSENYLSDKESSEMRAHVAEIVKVLARDKTGGCRECLPALERLAERPFKLKGLPTEVVSSLEGVQTNLRELVNLKRQYGRMDELVAGLKNRARVAQRKLDEIRRRRAESALPLQVEQLRSEIISAQSQIAERTQSTEASIASRRNLLEVGLGVILPALDQHLSNQIIVAPIDGTVSQFRVGGAGEVLAAGQQILELVPAHSAFVAELAVANRDISSIRKGMEVIIKLDALPEREFGTLKGKVESVPVTVDATDGGRAEGFYKVVVKLERQSLHKGNVEYSFRSGMTLQAHVIAERETILKLLVRRMFNLVQGVSFGA